MTMMQLLLTMKIAPLNSLTMTIMWKIFLGGAVLKSLESVERSSILYLGLRLTWMNFCCPCFVADIMSTCTQMGLYVISRTYPGRLRWGQKTNTMNESIIFFYFYVKQFLLQYRSNNFSTFDCSHPSFFQQVRFVCSEPTVLISSIKEISSCKYVVTIQSPMLCKNPYVLIFSS